MTTREQRRTELRDERDENRNKAEDTGDRRKPSMNNITSSSKPVKLLDPRMLIMCVVGFFFFVDIVKSDMPKSMAG